jgi:hypothetical protein
MMSAIMADFIPSNDGALKTWCTNFKSKIATLGASVGLTAAQITALQGKCDAINGRIDSKMTTKTAWLASVADSNTGNGSDISDLRKSIGAIKKNAGYTQATGADLGIVGGGAAFDPNSYQGELTGVDLTAPAQVTVSWGKANGNIDGVNVYMRRQGTSPWTFLARDTVSPYVDTTPLATAGQPEIREYRVRGVLNDVEIGDYSDTIQLTVN